jgi:hypothetical protein
MLFGCAGYQPKDIFAQSREWLAQTSDGAAADYDDEIDVLFAQPYIDPLTDYISILMMNVVPNHYERSVQNVKFAARKLPINISLDRLLKSH